MGRFALLRISAVHAMGPLMQGLHAFDPETKTVIDLESFVPDDHLLRDVDRLLEPALIRRLTACCYAEGKGRPSIDPVVYFRMVLVAYLYGNDSDRRLCEDVYCHLAYRWFCRLSLDDKVPDHSSFTKIRDRYGEEIHGQVFTEIVKLCQQHGLVAENCRVMTDATLIPADAAFDSLVHNDPEQACAIRYSGKRCRSECGRSKDYLRKRNRITACPGHAIADEPRSKSKLT